MNMNRRNLHCLGVMALLAFLVATLPVCAQTQDDEWECTVAPYVLFPGMSGKLGIGPIEADVDAGISDILSNLQFGFNGYFAVRKGAWGFGADIVYMALGGSTDHLNVDPNQGAYTFLGIRRLAPGLDLNFGARWNVIEARIEFKQIAGTELGGRVVEKTQQWVDPVVGIHWVKPLGQRWEFRLPANIGGFGLASKVAVDVFPTLQFKLAEWAWIGGGWRVLYMNYETGYEGSVPIPNEESFRYDVTTTGPVVGLAFRF